MQLAKQPVSKCHRHLKLCEILTNKSWTRNFSFRPLSFSSYWPVGPPTILAKLCSTLVVAYINKQGGTHSAEMCALLWKIMTWCHHYKITLKTRHIPGYLNVIADLLSRSNQVQSTELSLHLQVVKQICHKWFTPQVDLFATRLNHNLPMYMSRVPDQNAWDIDALNIN